MRCDPSCPNCPTIQRSKLRCDPNYAQRSKLPKLRSACWSREFYFFHCPTAQSICFCVVRAACVNLNLNYTHHFTNVEVTGLLSGSTRFGNVDYKAAAMIHHVGPSFTSGHYFCSLPTEDGQWWTIDDLQQNPLRLSASRLQLTVCCVLFERMTQPELHSQERAPSPEF